MVCKRGAKFLRTDKQTPIVRSWWEKTSGWEFLRYKYYSQPGHEIPVDGVIHENPARSEHPRDFLQSLVKAGYMFQYITAGDQVE